MLSKSFKPAKCKTALNLAKSRTKLMKNKKDSQLRQLRREVAQLLQNSQDQSARIRVEHVAREEKMLAAYELIEIYCELIVARLPVIESQKTCPLDLKEAITSLIFAAPRCGDIQELQDIRKHFTAKYGKDFVTAAIELRPACGVSRTMVEKLSVQAPDGPMKVKILKGIAEEHNIQWEPNWFKDEDLMPSSDTPKKLHADTNNKIQMERLSVQITDDLEEKHTHGTANVEHSSQKHSRTNVSEIPPSTSRLDSKPSGDVSEIMSSSQSSRTAKNAFSPKGQKWNMEFSSVTAAAQAAAESAERASMAARAAAELSIRDSNRRYEGDVLQHKHEQGNPISNSSNQRSPRMEGHQGIINQLDHVTEQRDTRTSNTEYSQSKVNHDTRKDLRESESEYEGESENEDENDSENEGESESASYHVKADSMKQPRDSVSSPSSSKGDYNWSKSSNIHEYETEPSENPFHEETVEPQNQHINNYSQLSGFGDEYDVFSNLKYRSDEIDSDSSFSAFGKGIAEVENWQAKSTYLSKSSSIKDEPVIRDFEERNVFKEPHVKNYGYDSGMDEGPSGSNINEKAGQNVATAVFDESGSDDDECKKYKSSSGEISPKHHVLLRKDNPYFESDLSDSFRSSSIYSKLIEPLPVTFDDDDEPSPKSEKELQTGNSEPEIDSSSYRTPDWDSHVTIGFIRSSLGGEKGTAASFMSNKQLEENQNLHVGSVQEGKKSESESPRSFRLPLQSKDRSEGNSETYSSSEGGVELNLQALPGRRRNRSTWLPPYTRDGFSGNSSPSSKATIKDGFRQSEDSSPTYKSQGSSGGMDNEHVSTTFNATKKYEAVDLQTHLNISEPSHSGIVPKNLLKTRAKNPTGYSGLDDCVSEEDSPPTPVMTKKLQGAGISRRTKGSRTSSRPDETKKSGRFSSNFSVASDSPKRKTETTNSRSEIIGQSSRNSDSFSTSNAENPETTNSDEIHKPSVSSEKAPPTRGNSGKNPSHVHPKLPDSFEAFTAHLKSLRTNRQ